jgi:hypothetical protein
MDERNTIDEMLNQNPLIGFSVYTQIQVRTLSAFGQEILDLLDSSMAEGSMDGQAFNRAYGMFWLWLLGAYEVTRTMCQAKSCFTAELSTKLFGLKKRLSALRMPFAKQEYEKEKTPIKDEASAYGVDTMRKDLRFEIKGTVLSVRDLISAFESVFGNIKLEDILSDHRASYRGAS